MNIENVRVIVGTVLLASAGCYAGVGEMGGDTDGAESDTEGETEGETEGSAGSGGPGGSGDESGESSGGGSADGNGTGIDPPEPPDGCLAGSIGCECLDGGCQGLSTCIDEVCTPAPPVPNVEGPSAALAGVAVPLDGDINVPDELDGVNVFDELEWEQVSGPDTQMEYIYSTEAVAWLPPDASDGAEFTFRLTAELGGVVESGEYTLGVLPASFEELLVETKGVPEFGATLVGRALGDLWLSTDLGVVTRVSDDGLAFEEDFGGRVSQIRAYGNNRVLFLQPELGRVMSFNGNNNEYSEFLSQMTSGDPLGTVTAMAVDTDGDIYFGCEDGRVVLYDDPDDAEPAVTLDMYTLAQTPTTFTIAQHPVAPEDDEDDEGVTLYYGTAGGDVWQVGLTASEDGMGPEVDTPELYVSVPGTGPVSGLHVDRFRNMWVGKGDTLYLVRRASEGTPAVVRNISAPSGQGGFVGLSTPDYEDSDRLDWIDPATGAISRLRTYME